MLKFFKNSKNLFSRTSVVFLMVLGGMGLLIYFLFLNKTPVAPQTFKGLVQEKIEQGKQFLFKAQDQSTHGFFKQYDAQNDDFGRVVYGVYSASSIYTLLNVYDFNKDEKILQEINNWKNFLIFMQNRDEKDRRYGAFHYSYDLDKKEKEQRFVVGTSAKAIFALLKLYQMTNNLEYLESAKLAGNWLTTMQKENGSMKPYVRQTEGKWMVGTEESILYNGQVLSALSRLFKITAEEKYYNTAKKIADYFAKKIEEAKGDFIEDDYRTTNPISNSWVVMSFLDFYQINPDDYYKDIIFKFSDKILENQKKDPQNLADYGRYGGAFSTSGVGWINEVMGQVFQFCKKEQRQDCLKFKEAMIRAMQWLFQNTYSKDNTASLKNPERAIGGLFWNKENQYVRIDSVSHALNSYLSIIPDL